MGPKLLGGRMDRKDEIESNVAEAERLKPTVVQKESLEPCDKPQAQEASRWEAGDEACDDGVD